MLQKAIFIAINPTKLTAHMKRTVECLVVVTLIGIALASVSCERIAPMASRSTLSKPVNSVQGQLLASTPTSMSLTSLPTIEESQSRPHPILKTVVTVSALNIAINILRPDPFIPPVMRLPRIILEACIGSMALVARKESMFWLILSLLTLVTAMIDIFVWGPVFAFLYVMGSSHLLASLQSTLGGVFYLVVAVMSWGQFWEEQDHKRRKWQANTLHQIIHEQQLGPLQQQQQGNIADSVV